MVLENELNEIVDLLKEEKGGRRAPKDVISRLQNLPKEMREAIYVELARSKRLGGFGDEKEMGKRCFYTANGRSVKGGQATYKGERSATNEERAQAIKAFLASDQFSHFFVRGSKWEGRVTPPFSYEPFEKDVIGDRGYQGLLQRWVEGSREVKSCLETTRNGEFGKELRDLPSAFIHEYALLQMIKGVNVDGHTGNTLIRSVEGEETEFFDIDEEHNFFSENFSPDYTPYLLRRVWVMGLPQAAEPFSKATLMGIVYGDVQGKVEKGIRKGDLSQRAREALFSRVALIEKECGKALESAKRGEEITLSPLTLFFSIFFKTHEEVEGAKFRDDAEWIQDRIQAGVPPLVFFDAWLVNKRGDGSKIPGDNMARYIKPLRYERGDNQFLRNVEALYRKRFGKPKGFPAAPDFLLLLDAPKTRKVKYSHLDEIAVVDMDSDQEEGVFDYHHYAADVNIEQESQELPIKRLPSKPDFTRIRTRRILCCGSGNLAAMAFPSFCGS